MATHLIPDAEAQWRGSALWGIVLFLAALAFAPAPIGLPSTGASMYLALVVCAASAARATGGWPPRAQRTWVVAGALAFVVLARVVLPPMLTAIGAYVVSTLAAH